MAWLLYGTESPLPEDTESDAEQAKQQMSTALKGGKKGCFQSITHGLNCNYCYSPIQRLNISSHATEIYNLILKL
jgi:hypothetical protein